MCGCNQSGGRVITSAQLQAAAEAKERVEQAARDANARMQAAAVANASSR
jgi:hypothetical protein